MSQELVGVKIEVTESGAKESVGSIRTQLKEATKELTAMRDKFGETSAEAVQAARRVAQLRDEIGDARAMADAFNPDAKFAAFGAALQGVAGGFSAVQGIMGLLGTESQEVEKLLLKVQSAMALSQGLNSILEAKDAFKNLGAVLMTFGPIQKANAAANTLAAATMRLFGVATTQTSVAFNVLKTAIIATGIGAIVVGIVALVSHLKELAGAAEEAAKKQRELNEAMSDYAQRVRDADLKIIESTTALYIARAKAAGEGEAGVNAIVEKGNAFKLESLRKYAEDVKNDAKVASDAQAAVKEEERRQEIDRLNAQVKARDEANQKAKQAGDKSAAASKAARDKADAEKKAADEAAKQAEQALQDELFKLRQSAEEADQRELSNTFAARIAAYEKAGKDTTALIEAYEQQSAAIYAKYRDAETEAFLEEQDKRKEELEKRGEQTATIYNATNQSILDAEALTYAQSRKLLEDQSRAILLDTRLTQEQKTELERTNSETRKTLAKKEAEAKIQAAAAVAGALDSFAELAGKQTAVGKTLAIASATISTYQGAQQAFTSLSSIPVYGSVLGAIAAAGAIAAGIARIKAIASVKVPGGGGSGGGGSMPSLGGGGAPMSPQTPQPTVTKLDSTTINAMGNQAIKAYVVESDVTGTQDKVRRITNASQFE